MFRLFKRSLILTNWYYSNGAFVIPEHHIQSAEVFRTIEEARSIMHRHKEGIICDLDGKIIEEYLEM